MKVSWFSTPGRPIRRQLLAPRLARAARESRQARHGAAEAGALRALQASGGIVLLTDAQRRITWCNTAFTALTGWSLAEARGRSPGELLQFDGTDPAAVLNMRQALNAGQGFRGELLNRGKNGRDYWLDIDIQPVRRPDGTLQAFIAVQTDVTRTRLHHDYLRNIANSAVAGLLVADERRIIIDCNPEAERLFELDEHRLVGRSTTEPPWELLDEDGQPLLPQHAPWETTLASGKPVLGQLVGLALADGRRRWARVSCERIPAPEEGCHVVVCSFLDVTAASESKLALKQTNGQLRGLFDLSPVSMSLSRLSDGVLLEINDAHLALLGHGRDRLGGLTHGELLPPEHLGLAQAHREQLLATGSCGPTETELLHADGHRVPVLLSGMLVSAADGGRHLWSMAQDLSIVKHMERRLRNEALTDRLTGLPNRTLLMERMEACMAHVAADPSQRFALLFLDIDRFKLVNDTLGHDAGDQLLQLVADRLRRVLRASDNLGLGDSLIARLGGDEFVVLLADVRTVAGAAKVARRLLDALAMPCLVAEKEIHSSASIGVVLADAECAGALEVLRDADMAMYEAKRRGRGDLAVFDHSMSERLSRAVLIESALRHAVLRAQLSLVYQPIVDLHSRQMASVEALLRWRHPDLGVVSPTEFIPIAEESGLIVPIGEWVLRQACGQWREWQETSPDAAPATMSVNLSRVQMALGDRLLALVSEVLAEHSMPAAALQLEVTEREVMRDPDAALRLMRGLRGLGVRLAMDDFGTGASSLSCLRDYPFDVIKIDKSFIDDVACSTAMLAVLHGTVMVIENLGMASVAEGVEDALQVGVLQSLGCRYAQGYLFSRPVPAAQLLGTLELTAAAR